MSGDSIQVFETENLIRTPNDRKPGRQRVLVSILIVAAASAVISAWTWWGRPTEIPDVDLSAARPALAALIRETRERVEESPNSASAWGNYGMCLMQHEFPVEAFVCFREAARLAPDSARWPYYAGVITEQTDYQQALGWYERSLQCDANYAPLRLRTAQVLSHLNRHQEAIETLQPLLNSATHARNAWPALLRLARISGDFQLASNIIAHARDAGMMGREMLLEEAMIAMMQGKSDEAMRVRQAASQLPPEAPGSDDPWMDRVRRFDVSGFTESQEADSLVQQGRFGEAIEKLSDLSQKFPERSRPTFNHALVLLGLGQTDSGIAELRKLSKSFPRDPMVHFYLAQAMIRVADYAESEAFLIEAIRLKPDFGKAHALLGDVYAQTGQPDKAIDCYSSAITQNPEEAGFRLQLARLLIEQKRIDEAQETLHQAFRLPTATEASRLELDRLRTLLDQQK